MILAFKVSSNSKPLIAGTLVTVGRNVNYVRNCKADESPVGYVSRCSGPRKRYCPGDFVPVIIPDFDVAIKILAAGMTTPKMRRKRK